MENIALVTIRMKSPRKDVSGPSSKPIATPKRCRPSAQSNTSVGKTDSSVTSPTIGVKFVSAGLAACTADLITFPLDTAKVRLQKSSSTAGGVPCHHRGLCDCLELEPIIACVLVYLFQIQGESAVPIVGRGALAIGEGSVLGAAASAFKYRGMFGTLTTISKEEGVRALYNGLVPGLQRQMAFASIRIGLYDSVKAFYISLFQAEGTVSGNNVGLRILAGGTTGAAAVLCAQPTDVVKVRMQAAGKGPKRYTGSLNAYKTIGAQEGMRGLWKGTLPNITRNAIVNAAELVSYDLVKEAIVKNNLMSDSMPCHFVSAFGAGFCATVVASPVDVVKTRYMNSGTGKYKGAFQCATKMYREGGLKAFYKGFIPSYMRLGSWNVVMFVTYEQMKLFFTDVQKQPHSIMPPVFPNVTLQAGVKKFM